MSKIDFDLVKQAAAKYGDEMNAFLRELIKFPSESCEEGPKAKRIKEQMDKLGFTKTWIDPLGNVMGWMGTGEKIVCFDGHIDTVGIGKIENWTFDPM